MPVHWEVTNSGHCQTYTCTCTLATDWYFPAETESLLCKSFFPTPYSWWCLCSISCQQSRRWETFTLPGSSPHCSLVVSCYLQTPMLFLASSSVVSNLVYNISSPRTEHFTSDWCGLWKKPHTKPHQNFLSLVTRELTAARVPAEHISVFCLRFYKYRLATNF